MSYQHSAVSYPIINDPTVSFGLGSVRTLKGTLSISIGYQAGQINQKMSSISIGALAGQCSQNTNAISIGYQAGQISQGMQSIAIGTAAGNNTQGVETIAIGSNAGKIGQSSGAVAIGNQAGCILQGMNSIAIGNQAGYNQAQNSIILNALGIPLNCTETGFYVKPIRGTASQLTLSYNIGTGEIVYTPSSIRYKTNIINLQQNTSNIYSIVPREFDLIEDNSHQLGFIAEELENVDTNLVYKLNNKPEGINWNNITVYLVSEIKKLRDRVQDLENNHKDRVEHMRKMLYFIDPNKIN